MVLIEAKRNGDLQRKLRSLERIELLLIDELGYIPFEREATDLLFNVISARSYMKFPVWLEFDKDDDVWVTPGIGLQAQRHVRVVAFDHRQTFSARPDRDQIFFQPRDLRREAADLPVELLELAFLLGLDRRNLTALVEERRQPLQSRCLPLTKQIGMHLMRGGKLRDRLLAAKQLLNDLGFEGGAVTLSHCSDPPYRCPDFLSSFLGSL